MDFHEAGIVEFDDSNPGALPNADHSNFDLVIKTGIKESEGRGGFDMVRMFRRLLRGGSKQRVVGG